MDYIVKLWYHILRGNIFEFDEINRIAYVNLSEEFETLTNGDTAGWINIYTVVNTLTLNRSLNINYVQLLLEGKIEQFIWGTIIDKLIPPSTELIKFY